jgi:hypothetical protein
MEESYHIRELPLVNQVGGIYSFNDILESFLKAVKEELNDYYKTLAALDDHNKKSHDSSSKMTLKRLFFWFQEPLIHVKLVCAVMEASKAQDGILTTLAEFSLHGNPHYSGLFKKLQHKSSIPIFNMILERVCQ